MEERKININTIAKAAKVSTTTVSNFINGTEMLPISQDTRMRIRSVMRELNYRPHIGGVLMRRNLMRRSKVGFILGDDCACPPLHVAGTPLVSRLLVELEHALDFRLNLGLEILQIKDEDSRSEWNAKLLDLDCVINFGQINGLMFDTLFRRNVPLIEIYSAKELRMHGDVAGCGGEFDFLYWRNDRQIGQLFDHFYACGARRFLFISSCNVKDRRPEYYGFDAEAKLQGFLRALKAHSDAEGNVISPRNANDFNMFREFELTRELLKNEPAMLTNVDAVICHNDIVAHGVASAAMEMGKLPGRDFQLSGEGNFREFQYWYPHFITSSADYAELTCRVCELIELRRSGATEDFREIEIPTLLLERS